MGQSLITIQNKIVAIPSDSTELISQLDLGDYYLHKPNQSYAELDSAMKYISRALKLARLLGSLKFENRALLAAGEAYFQKGDVERGVSNFQECRLNCRRVGDSQFEAEIWNKEGVLFPQSDEVGIAHKLVCYNNALEIFKALKHPIQVNTVMLNIANSHVDQKKFNVAEKELKDILGRFKDLQYKRTYLAYDALANMYDFIGNNAMEVFFRLEAIKEVELTGDTATTSAYYFKLGEIYTVIGKREDGLIWLEKSIAIDKEFNYYHYAELINFLIALGHKKKALDVISMIIKHSPSNNVGANIEIYRAFGNAYFEMGNQTKAEMYFLKMMNQDLSEAKRLDLATYEHLYLVTNNAISAFYLHSHQYEKAKKYLNNMVAFFKESSAPVPPIYRSNTYICLSIVEESEHHYKQSLDYYKLHKNIIDSIFNVTKNSQIEEFKIKYETVARDKDIKTLQSDSRIQSENVKNAELQRNVTFVGASMLIVMFGMAYNGYRNKRRSNFYLKEIQAELNTQNVKLLEGLDTQKKLVVEKEWLVKEIHHRVKNNLQIVISLLNTQSKYLDNAKAKEAIGESKHRMQAMSLIHQRLYQSENSTTVNLKQYIRELIDYLDASFITGTKLFFNFAVDNIDLDISQAIPIGLILNEAITNSIKYAFTETDSGTIGISITQNLEDELTLHIYDDGKGMQQNFDSGNIKSMGLRLISGLVKQINGSYKIDSNPGVSIKIIFKRINVRNVLNLD
ncbi:histidine kinase dimerization/phosphoacceptor domain -containing protein [Pedobacter sp. UYP30]|uniref:tetratricopeptide repeat-containing sensor histidine kinase n=1 Tax=Pedobacter sp. UYP30 TaxID=1756400 RepID=UPI00339481E2